MFRCRDLLSLPTMAKARLVAGEKGLDNGIRWSYKAENMNFAEWVHGQELLIVSTSIINSKDFDLCLLINEAIRLKISGVLLLVGEEYITSISKKVLVVADQNKFPIICLPGNIPLVDVFEELGHAIVYQETSALNHEDLLSEIIFGKQLNENTFYTQAKLLGYTIEGSNLIFMIHIDCPGMIISGGFIASLSSKLENLFWINECELIVSHFHSNLIGMTNEVSYNKLNHLLTTFLNDLKIINPDIKCNIGVGCVYDNVTLLCKSFTEASSCLKLANPIMWYDQLGFLKVLNSIDDKEPMIDYMNQVLGEILKYDKENDLDLFNTLVAYFDCNESMKNVAEAIYIHPNTVKYRLQKIEELSGLSLSKTADKMQLYNAILIWQTLQ